ncbi:hypothetical protein GCM10027405_31510 [Arthrobacter alkaliphilus]|uniref:hypothetical protein n=1 Tax=Arthrobacter alkaliphilus TaxID=369936 RepID=UPI001F39D3EF|nr:hypothetical protein [Arthrobacter alkaliphilus]
MDTTQQTSNFVDPGADYGLDIERATMFIANAREWAESSPYREIERNSLGWNILRAYAQISTSRLQAMTGRERYGILMVVQPGFLFRTPRPAWATRTYSLSDETGDVCTHEMRISPRTTAFELILEQTDWADPAGELHIGEPAVYLYVGDDRRPLNTHELATLAKSATAGAVQLHHALRG